MYVALLIVVCKVVITKVIVSKPQQSSWSNGMSETKLKLQIPCSECMQQPCDHLMMSQSDACSKCMQQPCYSPMMTQAYECCYCMGSVVSILSRIYLYSSYFEATIEPNYIHLHRADLTVACTSCPGCREQLCQWSLQKYWRHMLYPKKHSHDIAIYLA